jgi:hypothetical protein
MGYSKVQCTCHSRLYYDRKQQFCRCVQEEWVSFSGLSNSARLTHPLQVQITENQGGMAEGEGQGTRPERFGMAAGRSMKNVTSFGYGS